jgi:hypothetical protein
MKQRILLTFGFILNAIVGTSLMAAEQQSIVLRKVLLSDKYGLKDVRDKFFYPMLTIQEFGSVSCVNKKLLREIGSLAAYGAIDFGDVQSAIQLAWRSYQEDGVSPKVKLCFLNADCPKGRSQFRQEHLIAHWIKNVFRPGIWRESNCLIGTYELNNSLCHSRHNSLYHSLQTNNCLVVRSSNDSYDSICIDKALPEQYEDFNEIMTLYSIDQYVEALSQEKLDALISNKIEKPLVVIVEKSLIANDTIYEMLCGQFDKLKTTNDLTGWDCASKIVTQREIYLNSKKSVEEVNQVEKVNQEVAASVSAYWNPRRDQSDILMAKAIVFEPKKDVQAPKGGTSYKSVQPGHRPCITQ